MPSNINAILWMASSAYVLWLWTPCCCCSCCYCCCWCCSSLSSCCCYLCCSISLTLLLFLRLFVCMHSALLINGGCVKGQTRIIRPRVSRSPTHTYKHTLSLLFAYVRLLLLLLLLAWLSFWRLLFSPLVVVDVVVVAAGFCVSFIKTSGAILKQLYLGLPLG